jgi:hypothetical protein
MNVTDVGVLLYDVSAQSTPEYTGRNPTGVKNVGKASSRSHTSENTSEHT